MDRFPDLVVGTRAAGITERMAAYEACRACRTTSPAKARRGRSCTPPSTSSRSPSPAAARPTRRPRPTGSCSSELDLDFLWDRVGALPRNDRWQTHARAGLRDDLLAALRELLDEVLRGGDVFTPGRPAGEGVGRLQRAQHRAGRPGVQRDPLGRHVRPHDPVGRPAPAPQPRPGQQPRSLSGRRAPGGVRRRGRRRGAGRGASCRAAVGTGARCPRAGPGGRRWP